MLLNNFFYKYICITRRKSHFFFNNLVRHILDNQLLFIQRFKVSWFAASHPALFLLSSAQKYSVGQVLRRLREFKFWWTNYMLFSLN
jgi:hypothetical protein